MPTRWRNSAADRTAESVEKPSRYRVMTNSVAREVKSPVGRMIHSVCRVVKNSVGLSF